jgi:hypothetical protein
MNNNLEPELGLNRIALTGRVLRKLAFSKSKLFLGLLTTATCLHSFLPNHQSNNDDSTAPHTPRYHVISVLLRGTHRHDPLPDDLALQLQTGDVILLEGEAELVDASSSPVPSAGTGSENDAREATVQPEARVTRVVFYPTKYTVSIKYVFNPTINFC